jgi:hypothetical protein
MKTIADNIEEFHEQVIAVKMILFKHFTALMQLKFQDEELAKTHAAQITKYLIGGDLDVIYQDTEVPDDVKVTIEQIKKDIPILSELALGDNFLSELDEEVFGHKLDNGNFDHPLKEFNKIIRELVVYNLRMTLVLSQAKFGYEFIDSPEGVRITNILSKYGNEFTDVPSPEGYQKLINALRAALEI